MIGRFKIALLIFVVSAILPFVAFKLKAPQFLNPLERRIADFQEPTQIQIFKKKTSYNVSLDDPFKISERAKMVSKKDMSISSLSMIYKGKNKYVIFGDNIVKEGDRIGDLRVVKILNDKVLIKDGKGEEIWLRLENY